MKTTSIVAIAGALALIATPAIAGKKRSKKKKAAKTVEVERRLSDTLPMGVTLAARTGKVTAAPKLDEGKTGAAYELGQLDRRSTTPTGDAEVVVKMQPLTEAQVGEVVKAKGGTLEYCWAKLPVEQRIATTIGLHFTIEPKGTVSAFEIIGEIPAKAASCISKAAKRWSFPVADTRSDVEYAVDLK